MSNWSKSAFYGGIYTKTQKKRNYTIYNPNYSCQAPHASWLHSTKLLFDVFPYSQENKNLLLKNSHYLTLNELLSFWYTNKRNRLISQLEKQKNFWKDKLEKIIYLSKEGGRIIKNHLWRKQEIYLPVLIAIVLLALVFISKNAFSKTPDLTNNLPIKDNYKIELIQTNLAKNTEKVCSFENKEYQKNLAQKTLAPNANVLKEDLEKILKNTPMAAMTEVISQKPRPVAAFLVGIAMKESKFGIYSPKLGGRDCYNYWGFKGGGKTTPGGYSCFNSPEEAVEAVSKKIEKMIAKGVRTPAQAISWKCGSSCAGHRTTDVRKWISDVAINFYKIL